MSLLSGKKIKRAGRLRPTLHKPKIMLQVRRILQSLSDGNSKREANRMTGVNRNTIDVTQLFICNLF